MLNQKFDVAVDYDASQEDVIVKVGFQFIHPAVCGQSFSPAPGIFGEKTVELELFLIPKVESGLQTAQREFTAQGLRSASLHELIAFVQKHPSILQECEVVIYDPVQLESSPYTLAVKNATSFLQLNLIWLKRKPSDMQYAYLVAKK